MEKVAGWWFGPSDKKLLNGDGREVVIGETHKVDGEIRPCLHGLHLSTRILDALQYATGPVVYRVIGSGVVVPHGSPTDKYACSERTYTAGGIDISEILFKFARWCALDVAHLWSAPDVVLEFLKTGDDSKREAARGADPRPRAARQLHAVTGVGRAVCEAAIGRDGASWRRQEASIVAPEVRNGTKTANLRP